MALPPDKEKPADWRDSVHQKTITYSVCSKHNTRFPLGQRCPRCEAEEKKRSASDVS
jgi:hypothetical protein